VNSYPYATSGATHAFALASFNYANPVATNTQIVTSNNVGNLFTVYQTTLNATGASFANPSSVSAVGNTVGAFTFTAGYGSKSPIVKSITLSTNGSVIQGSTAQTLGLYDASNPSVLLGSATMAGTSNAVFSISGNQWMIPPGSSKTLLVKVLSAPTNLASMTNGATGNYQVLLQGVTWTDEVTANISSLSPNISMPIASQNITGLSTTASAPVISQVQNLTATTGSGSVNLSWSAATATNGVMQYLIYRSTVSGFTPSESNRIAEGNVLSYTDSSLAPGIYYYAVAAMDMKSVLGPASAQVGATVANAIIIAPRPIVPIKVTPLQSSASDASNQTAIISQSIQNLLSQLSGLLKSL